ncbi:MAG: hypothetical protein IKP76_02075 [Bacilli bacterium]|nr:hypothetical protein [Bacilli bacterium]
MKKNVVLMVIFSILFVGTMLFIGYSIKNRNKDYVNKENELKEVAAMYVNLAKINVLEGKSADLQLEQIIRDGYLEEIKVHDNECTGYITIKKKYNQYTYIPHIKCGKYESLKQ